MAPINKAQVEGLRGAAQLALDATVGIVDVVERMHRAIQVLPLRQRKQPHLSTRGLTGLAYRSVRGITGLVGRGINLSLQAASAWLPDGKPPTQRDTWIAALNGIYGDHLARTGNPLAIGMALRRGGQPVDPHNPAAVVTAPTHRLLVLVHGLCMTDTQWQRDGHDHGAMLAEAGGFTPVYLRYNSGLPVGDNGEQFAQLLEALVARWPVPVRELVIMGHSMGGLVARAACFHAKRLKHHWPARLSALVFLGTPQHGSPLERGGHGIDRLLQSNPYSAPFSALSKARSAGIQDLRHGTVTRGGQAHPALPPHVACYVVAATLVGKRRPLAERLVGDGLVSVDSALGRHREAGKTLRFLPSHRLIVHETGHLELLNQPEVAAQLKRWLVPARDKRPA
jgi:pimeloyl-ACP methyl ester carboxylesterase